MIPFAEHALPLAIAFPLLGAFSAAFLSRFGERASGVWAFCCLLASLAYVSSLALGSWTWGGVPSVYALGAEFPGVASFGGFPIRVVLVSDAVSVLVGLVAVSVSLLAAVYSLDALKGSGSSGKFYSLLLLLCAGMLGLSFTGDFFTMFVFLEVLSISSAGLVAFFRQPDGFEASFKFMVVSSVGILFLLFGVGLLYGKYGLLNIAAIAELSAQHAWIAQQAPFVDAVALALVFSALLLKAGVVPVHFWKPDAYQAAPPQVVAMLLASGLVGGYVFFRLCFLFSVSLGLNGLVGLVAVVVGILSIFVGVTMALKQSCLKRMMAYAAVAETGYVALALGVALASAPLESVFSFGAIQGGLFHLIHDVLDLGLLFMTTGAVLYITRSSGSEKLTGVAHVKPELGFFFLIGMLAISGMPPFNGFASKLLIYESAYYFNPFLSIIALLGSVMMLAVFSKAFASVFLGAPFRGKVRPLPGTMLLVLAVLAMLVILIGLFPGVVLEAAVEPAASALVDTSGYLGAVM